MIAISSSLYSLNNNVVVTENVNDTKLDDVTRRVSRVKTLDGGSVLNDGGFAESDRTMVIAFDGQQDAYEAVTRLARANSQVTVAVEEGVFEGVISLIRRGKNQTSVTFLPMRKLS